MRKEGHTTYEDAFLRLSKMMERTFIWFFILFFVIFFFFQTLLSFPIFRSMLLEIERLEGEVGVGIPLEDIIANQPFI